MTKKIVKNHDFSVNLAKSQPKTIILAGFSPNLGQKHGFCQRLAHPNDARRVVVHINRAGEELMEKVFSKYHEIEDVAVSDLSSDEFETTIDSLRTMLHTMEEFNNKGKS